MTERKTILITGASSGIGHAAALLFQKKDWNVVATMRSPEKETTLTKRENVLCAALDVTKPETISTAIEQAITRFGGIDVLVNNAGYGLVGPFENSAEDHVRKQFDTNVLGSMSVIRAILPYFRQKKSGTIINVTSMGGLLTFPFYSVYHATKWAMEGFSESLQFELRPWNIHVKMIEPGAIATEFYGRSLDVAKKPESTEYDTMANAAIARMNNFGNRGVAPERVANVMFKAANDTSWKQRYRANSVPILTVRRLLPTRLFNSLVRMVIMRRQG